MSQVFFDVDNGSAEARDKTGVDISTLAAVRGEVIIALDKMFRDRASHENRRTFKIKVRDDHDIVLLTASLAFEITTSGRLDGASNGAAD